MAIGACQTKQLPIYDTRCYFNVRSKADMSQLNLPHETTNLEKQKNEKLRKRICSEVSVHSPENPWSQSDESQPVSVSLS